jgi:hypothetical protein
MQLALAITDLISESVEGWSSNGDTWKCSKWGAEWKNLRGRGDNELLVVMCAETIEMRGRRKNYNTKFQNSQAHCCCSVNGVVVQNSTHNHACTTSGRQCCINVCN